MAYFKSNKVETRIANILKGTSDPSSSIGDNGQLYLKYIDIADAYLLREYIEVGNTAGPYINTGLTTSSNDAKLTTEAEVIYSYTDRPDHNTWMFGAFSGYGIILGYQNGQTEGYVGSGGKLLDYDTNVHTVEFKDGGLYADDTLKQTGNWTQIPNNTPIYIFGRGGDNRVIKNTRIYRCKIWQNGVLLRDLIPVQRKSDDEIGMLDLVNNVFYDNDGTGSFTCGGTSDISSPIFKSYAKVNGQWQNLIGTNIDDIDYMNNPPKTISYLKWQITKSRSVPAGGCIQIAEFRLYQNAEKYVWNNNVSISSDMTGVSGETIDKLIDDNTNTKFNTQDWGSVQENECNIIINLGETITLTNTSSYCFVTANDEISRDPVSWKLYSSVDGTNWDLLDERTDADVPTDRERQTFNYPCNIGGGTSVDTSNLLFKDGEFYNTDKVELGIANGVVSDGAILFTPNGSVGGIYFNSSTIKDKFVMAVHYENDNQSVQVRMQYGTSKVGTSVINVINSGTDRYTYASKSVNKGVNDLVPVLKETDGDDTIGAFFGNQSANATWKIYEIYLIPY